MNKRYSQVTLILIILITVFLQLIYFLNGNKEFSEFENRVLHVFPELNISAYLKGDFQDQFEGALNDQIFQRNAMIVSVNTIRGENRKYYNAFVDLFKFTNTSDSYKAAVKNESIKEVEFETALSKKETLTLSTGKTQDNGPENIGAADLSPDPTQPQKTNWLEPIGDVYRIGDTDFLTIYPLLENEEFKTSIRIKGNQINEMMMRYPQLKVYAYFITKTEDLDWFDESEGIKTFDYASYVAENLPENVMFKKLEYSGMDELMEWSYKTDHHWNHKGAHKGYTDIYSMISRDFELSEMKEPTKELDFNNLKWIGSNGRRSGVNVKPDIFRAYEYDLGQHESYVGDELKETGSKAEYKKGEIRRGINVDQYIRFYGREENNNIIKHVFKDNTYNLLMITDSNNKPFRSVLASHFNTTIVIDYRMLRNVNIDDLIENYNIDAVLFAAENRYWCDENIHRINDGIQYVFPGYPIIID